MLPDHLFTLYIKLACLVYITWKSTSLIICVVDQPISDKLSIDPGPNLTLEGLNKHQVVPRSKNYASAECAEVVETNPEAKKASHIINEKIDDYMLSPCKTKIWFVIELCETIQATQIKLANYELFSSSPKDFTVYFSDVYPTSDWKLVGNFTATDSRALQTFDLNQVGFGKYIRVELNTHHGYEYYCPISEVKVYGTSMVDEYEKQILTDKEQKDQTNTSVVEKRPKRKTSAYRVYYKMMTEIPKCGLSQSKITKIEKKKKPDREPDTAQQNEQQPKNTVLPQPTPQPNPNKTIALKPSIFVELSNKVKALETTVNLQKEDIDSLKRDLEEAKIDHEKFRHEYKSISIRVWALVLALLVYKLFLDLML